MPKDLDCSTTSTLPKKAGQDFFSYYSSEVEQLLSRDEGHLPFSASTAPLFSNVVGTFLSDSKKERLKSLLRQSTFSLTKEVDEMIDPILSVCRIQSCLECKEQLLSLECKVDNPQGSHKRVKHGCSNGPVAAYPQINEDIRFLLEGDTTRVEELVKKQSNEFLDTLRHMEQKFKELLNLSMTSCRQMTLAEKLQLRRSFQSLSPRNLDRVVEIMQSDEKFRNDEVHVDLDRMENATLWRLYFYFATVQGKNTTEDSE